MLIIMCNYDQVFLKNNKTIKIKLYIMSESSLTSNCPTARERERGERLVKMHSLGYRANALLTFSLMALALICAMASITDTLHSASPSAFVEVIDDFFCNLWIFCV